MKVLTLSIKAVVESRAEVEDRLKWPGDAVLIIRGQPRWLLLKCPCGCGDEIPVNLDRRAGQAWRFYSLAKSGVSLFPSVWRDTGCESHFIIRHGQIHLFAGQDDDDIFSPDYQYLRSLASRVLERWPPAGWVSFEVVAEELDEVPWDVLDACRYLAHAGSLIDGRGQQRGLFRRC